jgi:glutamate-1-semialdehyde aminotransferase
MSTRDQTAETLWEEARELLAYGGQHRMLLRSLYRGEDSVFPRFAIRAQGCEIVDESGRTYLDWSSAWGPAVLGYRHPAVEAAIEQQFEAGPTLPLIHPVELDVARAITELVPCAEMVAFGKNGSDVVTAAVRVARAATGRDVILQCGFHGFHDWYTCTYENVAGTPHVLRQYVESFPYNDMAALEHLFEVHKGEVAAVVMEPVNLQLPDRGYLENVKRLAAAKGALLVFDELVTAFRLAPGGAQELFGVEPDIACLGKAMANGMPLSAVVGRREHMRHLPHVAYGMTFRGETLSLAAARATLGVIRDEGVPARLAEIGRAVRAGVAQLCGERDLRCELTGPDARMTFVFEEQGGIRPDRLHTLFLQECAVQGVLTNGTLLPCFAHDDEAVERTLESFGRAFDVVADVVHGNPAGAATEGTRTMVARGFIDGLAETEEGLVTAGWLLVDDEVVDRVVLVARDGTVVPADPVSREGVAQIYPDVADAKDSGWQAVLPRDPFRKAGLWEFELRALRGDAIVFTCAVARKARGADSLPALKPPYEVKDGLLYI